MENKMRLIEANALKWKIGQVCLYVASLRFGKTIISKILETYRKAVFEEIDNAPTVDAVEVVHGRWKKTYTCSGERLWGYECDQCKADNPRASCYCPNCGAKMDGGNSENSL